MVFVVCTGGEAPPRSLCRSWLETCDTVLAADSGLELLKAAGCRADLWIGDGDSLVGADAQAWADETLWLDEAKDETDTEAAVRVALERGASEVWLLGGAGGRMDHWWANLRLAGANPRLTRWLTLHEEVRQLGPGERLDLPAGLVSVFPVGTGPWKISSMGLRWPLDPVDFTRWHSLSNVALQEAAVTVIEGRVLVLLPFEGRA